jgi:hypothetical protein
MVLVFIWTHVACEAIENASLKSLRELFTHGVKNVLLHTFYRFLWTFTKNGENLKYCLKSQKVDLLT